ncbi:MAG TPA: 23S rRNA (adenine(2503)-C(2))-methyltransferase RlmN [Firmicutes bacterium]|jgi:23S rRNA (adenine2503-C2)-methyltransferase|nr:23S rRNA (adenine(2503)-C(2))-methyltransferase RlmN [Bacillota bacterium]
MEITGLDLKEVEALILELGEPRYRARQLLDWVYKKGTDAFGEMSNLPLSLQRSLQEQGWRVSPLAVAGAREARDGTKKYLFRLPDGFCVEAVYIPEVKRKTVCFSTQVGCAVGCVFCATGQQGFKRNLMVGEIVDQVRKIGQDRKIRISHAVAMGQGEPLANYERTLKAIRILNADYGLKMAARHLTISTSGIVPAIYRLATEELQINLALSLHATEDQLRSRLIPLNRTYPLAQVMKACRDYAAQTKRRVTLEYIMIAGVNDGEADLDRLIKLATGWLCHVNLIPYNPVPAVPYQPSPPRVRQRFLRTLEEHKVAASIRQERGGEVEAACGQLRQQLKL